MSNLQGANVETQPSPIAGLPDGSSSGEPESPGVKILSKEELTERDRQAIAYSKTLLVEGDTLIYITYPGDSKCFDSTGFEISAAPHRVHSGRLMATGSKVFEKLLGPTEQFRILRRRKLVKNLPRGISYVLDLTPPDEGDEAVLLTAELSCSYGIRCWYTSSKRCLIAKNLVSGEDEVISSQRIASYGSPASTTANSSKSIKTETNEKTGFTLGKPFNNVSEAVKLAVEELDKAKAKKKAIGQLVVPEYCPVRHRAGIGRLLHVIEGKDPRLDSAPKVWTLFALAKYFDCAHVVVDWIVPWLLAEPNSQFVEILPEASCKMGFGMKNYLVTRAAFSILVSEEALSLAAREVGHCQADRDGTNQFGRIREDIDEDLRTRIEYASKAFHDRIKETFDSLVDERMEWVDKLPEFQMLKRFEHVFSYGSASSRNEDKWREVLNFQYQLRTFVRHQILATLKKPLSENEATSATEHRRAEQYLAEPLEGENFAGIYSRLNGNERIFTRFLWKMILYIDFPDHWERRSEKEWNTLHAPSMSDLWTNQWSFNRAAIDVIKEDWSNGVVNPLEAFSRLDELQQRRSDLLAETGLDIISRSWGNEVNSSTENHAKSAVVPDVLPYQTTNKQGIEFKDLLVTRPVEMNITSAPPKRGDEQSGSGAMPQPGETTNLPIRPRFTLELAPNIKEHQEIENSQLDHPDGQSSHESSWCWDLPFRRILPKPSNRSGNPITEKTPLIAAEAFTSQPSTSTTAQASQFSLDHLALENSPFFSLGIFLLQAKDHIRRIATTMLSASDIGLDIALTDTILCLSQDEFKYLPLWAGGDDDDSGGVFEDVIPVATAGPVGPGPAFHTGFSQGAAGSRASSEWEAVSSGSGTGTSGFNTSIAVEDGHSEHVDRRRIVALSDGDFSSETLSADGDMDLYDDLDRIGGAMGKDKGKEVDRSIHNHDFSIPSLSSAASPAPDRINHEGISEDPSYEIDVDVDVDFNVDDDDEEDDNATTVGEIDQDEMDDDADAEGDEDWDGGEEESFEFADMDDYVDHEEGADIVMADFVSQSMSIS